MRSEFIRVNPEDYKNCQVAIAQDIEKRFDENGKVTWIAGKTYGFVNGKEVSVEEAMKKAKEMVPDPGPSTGCQLASKTSDEGSIPSGPAKGNEG